MYNVIRTNRFDKDLVKCQKRGLDLKLIFAAIKLLEETGHLPREYKPHKLKGKFKGVWECHIEPNWLMTWEQNDNELTLLFLQIGTHVDLFGW